MSERTARIDLEEIMAAALTAANPGDAVRRHLNVENGRLQIGGGVFEPDRVFALAVGKAAGSMARATAELLGEQLYGGLCVAKYGHEAAPEPFETLFAAHPEPDERSVAAARRAEELLDELHEDDLLLVLVSGGASALLADPAPGIGIEDLKSLTSALLNSGAEIGEINTVRKHISTLKGGNLIRRAAPARVAGLLLSDVVGDHLPSIGSGLTVPDPTTLEQVHEILKRYKIEPAGSVSKHLGKEEETPKPGEAEFESVPNVIVGGGRLTARAAAGKARELGYEPLLLTTRLTGEARIVAGLHAAIVREILETGDPAAPPCAIVTGGEATVAVRGSGTGGPNLEFSLALALELNGVGRWAALAIDTDGNDGPTDAAGGLVDGTTITTIQAAGLDPEEALEKNDAYHALNAAGTLVKTGPTGTNVNDLRVVLVRRDE